MSAGLGCIGNVVFGRLSDFLAPAWDEERRSSRAKACPRRADSMLDVVWAWAARSQRSASLGGSGKDGLSDHEIAEFLQRPNGIETKKHEIPSPFRSVFCTCSKHGGTCLLSDFLGGPTIDFFMMCVPKGIKKGGQIDSLLELFVERVIS